MKYFQFFFLELGKIFRKIRKIETDYSLFIFMVFHFDKTSPGKKKALATDVVF